jgi:hypothetical protein
MAIHYENYQRFSKGQGFAGVLCRGFGVSASSKRWMAVDCQACREKIVGREVISREGERGCIEHATQAGIEIARGDYFAPITWAAFDKDWAPLDVALAAVFGDE